MGIPYSREINTAFAQVTPLVAAGFEVLNTTKNISLLVACVQIVTALALLLNLLALLALICTVHPDLERERDEVVAPVMRRLVGCAGWVAKVLLVAGLAGLGVGVWWGSRGTKGVVVLEEEDDGQEK